MIPAQHHRASQAATARCDEGFSDKGGESIAHMSEDVVVGCGLRRHLPAGHRVDRCRVLGPVCGGLLGSLQPRFGIRYDVFRHG